MDFDHKPENLNDCAIWNADGPPVDFPGLRKSVSFDAAAGEVHFHDLESALISEIEREPIIVGCVAWLTNERILKALATRTTVSVIVNKEDFLRPDKGTWSQQKVKRLYAALPSGERTSMGCWYSFNGDTKLDAVRCAGIYGDRKSVPPRMHHKFLVFCRYVNQKILFSASGEEISRCAASDIPDNWYEDGETPGTYFGFERDLKGISVWTGSFNLSENGTRSLENAVVLRSPEVAAAYLSEWRTIVGISEPLDWESAYVDPEWRIGT
jgi:hypothetical protein